MGTPYLATILLYSCSTLLSSPCVGTIQFLHKRVYIHLSLYLVVSTPVPGTLLASGSRSRSFLRLPCPWQLPPFIWPLPELPETSSFRVDPVSLRLPRPRWYLHVRSMCWLTDNVYLHHRRIWFLHSWQSLSTIVASCNFCIHFTTYGHRHTQ